MAKNKLINRLVILLERVDNLLSSKTKTPQETEQIQFRKKQNQLNRRLTSFTGKLVDSISFRWIGFLIIGLILFCAIVFYYFDITNKGQLCFFEAIYFSVVTMTSLGYGDISPTGFGRVVASFEVLSGVMLVAVFVGKIASERQSTLLLLLYNNENNRRLKEFYLEVKIFIDKFNDLLDEHEHKEFNREVKKAYKFMTGVYNYLSFHAHQGRMADFGNFPSLKRVYVSVYDLQVMSKNASKTHGPDAQTKVHLERLIFRINGIANLMKPFHAEDVDSYNVLNSINVQTKAYEKAKLNTKSLPLYRVKITEKLKLKVLAELPPLPWKKNLNVIIGEKLGLPYKFTERIIKKLVEEGLAPDPRGQGNI